MRELLGMDKALDRLDESHAGGDEDREHDRVASPTLRTLAVEQEGGPDGYCGERIACVVDQIGEKRD